MKSCILLCTFVIFNGSAFILGNHLESSPIDIYVFDTKIDKDALLKDYPNAMNIKYNESLMQLIYERAKIPFTTKINTLEHGTNIASLLLGQLQTFNQFNIYDIPVASSDPRGKKVDENLLLSALYEVGLRILEPSNQCRHHTILVLSISIPLSLVPNAEGMLLLENMTQLIKKLIKRNVHVMVAAGNEKISVSEAWPSNIEGVYSIGGLMSQKTLAKKTISKYHTFQQYSFSNSNAKFYDLAANVPIKKNQKVITKNGTSYANAIAAGKLAFLLSKIPQPIHSRDMFGNVLKEKFIYDTNGRFPMILGASS